MYMRKINEYVTNINEIKQNLFKSNLLMMLFDINNFRLR